MGMSGPSGGKRGVMAEINVTPFVDVMLVLLIIFMITTPMMVQGMDVQLPRAQGSPLQTTENQMIISISADGEIYINETHIPSETVRERLTAIVAANPEQKVFLKADGSVPYARIAALIGAAKAAGIPNVGLVTQPELETL